MVDLVCDLVYWWWYRPAPALTALPPLRSPLLTQSATSLARQIKAGRLTSQQVVAAFIQRQRDINPQA